jgi:hypothetical protein
MNFIICVCINEKYDEFDELKHVKFIVQDEVGNKC